MNQTDKYAIIAGNLIDGIDDTYKVTDVVEKPASDDAPTNNKAIIGH